MSIDNIMLTIHVIAATGAGYYVLFPFLAASLGNANSGSRLSVAKTLSTGNRIVQYLLLIQLITGSHLMFSDTYGGHSSHWEYTGIALVVLLLAFGGMISKPLRKVANDAASGTDVDKAVNKVRGYSIVLSLLFIAEVALMTLGGQGIIQ